MTVARRWTLILIIGIAVAIIVLISIWHAYPYSGTHTATTTPEAYGMSEYTDSLHGFVFWYPSTFTISTSTTNDTTSFPGGIVVETLQVGPQGGTEIVVVDSPQSTITDESAHHASPIPQTKYFYDSSSGTWMVAYPEGSIVMAMPGATTTADISKTTIGGLPMLPSGRRFDTTIIPLSSTKFVVVTDGGGSLFTSQLAETVAPIGVSIDPAIESNALQAEASAYESSRSAPGSTGSAPAAPSEKSVVSGTVLLSPTCPVEHNPPLPQCADKPYQTSILVQPINPSGLYTIIESDSSGNFSIALNPGTYRFTPVGGDSLPTCRSEQVTVAAGKTQSMRLDCDTGIR